jgi:hypothetical protein
MNSNRASKRPGSTFAADLRDFAAQAGSTAAFTFYPSLRTRGGCSAKRNASSSGKLVLYFVTGPIDASLCLSAAPSL